MGADAIVVVGLHDRSGELRLQQYHESLGMLQRIAPQHPLVRRLADELEARPLAG